MGPDRAASGLRSLDAGGTRPRAGKPGIKFLNRARIRQVSIHPNKYRRDYGAGDQLVEQPRTKKYGRRPGDDRDANHGDRTGNPERVKTRTDPRGVITPVGPRSADGAKGGRISRRTKKVA